VHCIAEKLRKKHNIKYGRTFLFFDEKASVISKNQKFFEKNQKKHMFFGNFPKNILSFKK
jgi:hypothetical protein